jgi:hypothetical protein
MLVGLNSLNKLFAQNPGKSKLDVSSVCQDCGRNLKIEIHATSGGFGIQNGALFEPQPDVFCTKCAECYQKRPALLEHKATFQEPRVS